MLSEKEVSLVYETLLSSPGMNEVVKLDLRMPRKQVLLLAKVLEKGLQLKPSELVAGLMQAAGSNCLAEMQQTCMELLQKAGLAEMNEKLITLQTSGSTK